MKKWIKYLIIFLISILFLVCCLLIWAHFCLVKETEISLISDKKTRPFIIPVEIDGKTYRFVWDTGAAISSINIDLAHELGYYGKENKYRKLFGTRTILEDTFPVEPLSISLGEIDLKASFYLLDHNRLFPNDQNNEGVALYDSTEFVGIIGQNIIYQYHWLFDFKEQKVKINNYGHTLGEYNDDIFKLNFTLSDISTTLVNLCINESDTFKFLFDTGYSGMQPFCFSDKEQKHNIKPGFVFSDSLLAHISQKWKWEMVELSAEDRVIIRIYDSLQINEKIFGSVSLGDNSHLHDRGTANYITSYFAYRFRQMYYNPDKKEISFYVSPKDSAIIQQTESERALFNLLKGWGSEPE